jgi:hypothetical protein
MIQTDFFFLRHNLSFCLRHNLYTRLSQKQKKYRLSKSQGFPLALSKCFPDQILFSEMPQNISKQEPELFWVARAPNYSSASYQGGQVSQSWKL